MSRARRDFGIAVNLVRILVYLVVWREVTRRRIFRPSRFASGLSPLPSWVLLGASHASLLHLKPHSGSPAPNGATATNQFAFFQLYSRRYEALFRGTFAPFLRASERPMAIACLRLLTFLRLRPLRSVPLLRFFIARSTYLEAPLEYLRAIRLLLKQPTMAAAKFVAGLMLLTAMRETLFRTPHPALSQEMRP